MCERRWQCSHPRRGRSSTGGLARERLLSLEALVAKAWKLKSTLLKVGPKEGSIEPSSWGRKVIRRWERREDYQAQENHLKRKGYQLTSQNSGPKAEEKHIAIRYLTGFQHGQMRSNQYFNQEQTEAESLTISNVQNDTTRSKHQKSLTIANCTYEAYKLYLY